MRWGILGAGNIAHRFADSLSQVRGAQLQAISGRSEEKLRAFAGEHPCERVYAGHEALLRDESVEAVYLALPHALHREWALRALSCGKAVLSEKPAALSEREIREITDCSRENHALYMEGMKTRFEPAYRQMKRDLWKIGALRSVQSENCWVLPDERYGRTYHTRQPGGGCLYDTGCYGAALLEDLLPGEIRVEETSLRMREGVDVHVRSVLSIGSARAELECGFDREVPSRAVLVGSEGRITLWPAHRPTAYTIELLDGRREHVELPYEIDDFYPQICHFETLHAEGELQSPVMSWEASLRTARLLDAVRASFAGAKREDGAES